jgi:hypothetical protein
MSLKRPALVTLGTALAAGLAPTRALAHADILAGTDPVAAVIHFVSEPDHAIGLVALAVAALAASPRLRAAARQVLRRRRR